MARSTKGRLFKRGKKGYYYLQYYTEGTEHKVALRDEHGEPITTERKAREAADIILTPLKCKNEAQRLRTLVNELATVEQKAEMASADIKNAGATLEKGWELFISCPSCPDTFSREGIDPRTHTRAYICKGYYKEFLKWMAANYPKVKLLVEVTPEMAERYNAELKANYGNHGFSVNAKTRIVRQVFQVLIYDERIVVKTDPFKRIKNIKEYKTTKEALTIEEVMRLLEAAPNDETRRLIMIGFFTGLRLGDCCTLEWGEVDLIRGMISRIPNKMALRVPNPEEVRVRVGIPRPLLMELLNTPPDERMGYVLPKIGPQYTKSRTTIYEKINKLFKAAGIATVKQDSKGREHPNGIVIKGFHSLRHTFVSLSAEAGVPQQVIQRIVGHTSPLMTMHYTHIGDNALRQSAALLPALPIEQHAPQTIEAHAEPIDEREELHRMIDTLPIEKIRELLTAARR